MQTKRSTLPARALILATLCGSCVPDRSKDEKRESVPDPKSTTTPSTPDFAALASAVASEKARQATPAATVDPTALAACADELPQKVLRIHMAQSGDPGMNKARGQGAAAAARVVRKVVDLKKISPIDQQLTCELAHGPDTIQNADAIVQLGNRLEGKLF